MKRFFRANSAYGNSGVYRELLNAGAHFTICLKENVWSSILENNQTHLNWKKSNTSQLEKIKHISIGKNQTHLNWKKSKVHFFDSNSCETASCAYFLRDLPGRNFLRVVLSVLLREKKLSLGKNIAITLSLLHSESMKKITTK